MRPIEDIKSYHVHVYYDDAKRAEAAALREAMEQSFDVTLGRWRDEPVGPHPEPMYQVSFEQSEFDKLVPWLMLNHGSLDVLIHPNTGEDVPDHRDLALWLGNKLPLDIEFLERFEAEQAARQETTND